VDTLIPFVSVCLDSSSNVILMLAVRFLADTCTVSKKEDERRFRLFAGFLFARFGRPDDPAMERKATLLIR